MASHTKSRRVPSVYSPNNYCCRRIPLRVSAPPNYPYDPRHMLAACPLKSVWSSLTDHFVCGWKAVLMVNRVPIAFWKLFQKCMVNLGSLSDTIDTDTPCNRTISRIYNRQNSSSVKVIHTARKCADFVSQSTITHTASCLRGVRGKWVIKSIVTCSHFHSATSNGWSSPVSFWCSALTCRHVRHLQKKSPTCLFIPLQ